MTDIYLKLKLHIEENNPILIAFMVIFPALTATYSVNGAFFIMCILTLLLLATRVSSVLCLRYLPKFMAFNVSILLISTYITLVLLITNAIYPGQLLILIIPASFLSTNNIISVRFAKINHIDKITNCLIDGLIYFSITTIYILLIGLLNKFFVYSKQSPFSLLTFAVSTLILNFIRVVIENHIERTNQQKEC